MRCVFVPCCVSGPVQPQTLCACPIPSHLVMLPKTSSREQHLAATWLPQQGPAQDKTFSLKTDFNLFSSLHYFFCFVLFICPVSSKIYTHNHTYSTHTRTLTHSYASMPKAVGQHSGSVWINLLPACNRAATTFFGPRAHTQTHNLLH